ncbi:hypothetical protein BCR44DRAFT_34359 [Catenaria anguillulae PL171]|uniref:Nucleotidyltransferase family protein n=1 Tax=Catenaria anguillulae PL171 TaxID=765915 RepID=A0A1Y2HN13_9FUNG|nr:hypothetical protein BCR44DRAFT_34359 [Catenaria anguillulae PL171]
MQPHSQPAIFADLVARVASLASPAARTLAGNLHHSSGGLPDLAPSGELSDVDVSVVHPDPHALLDLLQQAYANASNAEVVMDEYDPDQDYAIVAIRNMYPRPVHVYAATSALTAVAHRKVEVRLNATYPRLATMALALKRYAGMGTEEAWYRVLELGSVSEGQTPWYAALLDEERVMAAAEERNRWVIKYVDEGGLPKQ